MRKSKKDYTDDAAARAWYASMSPAQRELWLRDNPTFKDSDHSDLTVLQWREHSAIRKARSTGAAHAYADAIRQGNFVRAPTGNVGLSRGEAAWVTLSGAVLKAVLLVPVAYAIGGAAMATVAGMAMLIYATIIMLGSIISARPL